MNFLKNSNQPKWVDWIFYASIVFICWVSFFYQDIVATMQHGINIWDSNITNFYTYSTENRGISPATDTAVYPYLLYLIFGIWNLPTWLITKLTDTPMILGQTYMYFLWAKLMIVAFVGYSAYLVYKICLEMDIEKNKAKWCTFVYLSSINMIIPAFVVAQYDILTIVFSLLGIRALNKQNIQMFLLYFALAISIKVFAFFIFVPLVLLTEKKLNKIIKYIVIGLSLYVGSTMLFSIVDPAYSEVGEFSKQLLSSIFRASIPGFRNFSIFAIIYSLICFFSLIKKPVNDNERKLWIIWIPMVSFITLYSFMTVFHYYWMIVITPFMCIAMFQNESKINFLLWCNMIAELGSALVAVVGIYWVFDIKCINSLGLFSKIFNIQNQVYTQMIQIIPKEIDYFFPNMWIMGILLFIIATYPNNKISILPFEGEVSRSLILFRLFLSMFFIGIYLFCYFYTGDLIGSQTS